MSAVLVNPAGGPSPARRVLAVALVALLPSVAHAGRVCATRISVDGKTWLAGAFIDGGLTQPADVWWRLASNELQPADGVTIPPDPADPLRATLRGKIVIDVQCGGQAEAKELRLIRRAPGAGWTVDLLDVQRLAKEIGLDNVSGVVPQQRAAGPGPRPTSAPAAGGIPWLWVAGGGAAVLAAVLIGVTLARRVGSVLPASLHEAVQSMC
jgi:hypothetical protein